jgi:hypothetical protein
MSCARGPESDFLFSLGESVLSVDRHESSSVSDMRSRNLSLKEP